MRPTARWGPQPAAPTAACCRVTTLDLRGYGESPVIPGKAPRAGPADDPAALPAGPEIERVVVGGVSMGGRTAMEKRLRHPCPVSALVLSDTTTPRRAGAGSTCPLRGGGVLPGELSPAGA
ncbi:alpha/beta fold hydrolase [Streptomyces sp. NPDC058612]|uniref:alpha/beta fold hydrolase n=1 Tax=Streptomyces sp. NPDC058612 TaxID=3346555 RepID=UPI003661B8B2